MLAHSAESCNTHLLQFVLQGAHFGAVEVGWAQQLTRTIRTIDLKVVRINESVYGTILKFAMTTKS